MYPPTAGRGEVMTRKLKKGPIPLYYQLERGVRKRILTDKITFFRQFPTERQLGEEFGVRRIPVRHALMILENEGLLSREQGRGTLVIKRDGARIPYDLYGYVDDLFFLGAQSRPKLNGKKLIKVDSRVASDMGMEDGEEVYWFEGVRIFGGRHQAARFGYEARSRPSPFGDQARLFLQERECLRDGRDPFPR